MRATALVLVAGAAALAACSNEPKFEFTPETCCR